MDGKSRREVKERFDLALGFIGAFALAFLIITFVLELHDPGRATVYSLTTIVLLGIEVAVYLLRRRALNRSDGTGDG